MHICYDCIFAMIAYLHNQYVLHICNICIMHICTFQTFPMINDCTPNARTRLKRW